MRKERKKRRWGRGGRYGRGGGNKKNLIVGGQGVWGKKTINL
jgi:hypothetical protein